MQLEPYLDAGILTALATFDHPDGAGDVPEEAPVEAYLDEGARLEVVDPDDLPLAREPKKDPDDDPAVPGRSRQAVLMLRRSEAVGAFDVYPLGLGYEARIPVIGVGGLELRVDRLRDVKGELTGELTVLVQGRHVSRARFNFSSTSTRASLGKWLSSRTDGAVQQPLPWAEVLEDFCLQVLDLSRRGAPVVEVGRGSAEAPARWLLDPILRQGVAAILFGPGGSGKSTLATAIATSVQSGRQVVPGWVPTQSKVLVLDWEDERGTWTERIKAIAAGAGIEPPVFGYQTQLRPLAERVEELAAYVAENHIGLIIVDSVGLACGAGREGGTAEESALRMFEALRRIGTTSLLIDHVTGADLGSDRPISRPYGSVYKVNLARSVYELRTERDSTDQRAEMVLVHNKVNDGPKQKPIGLAVVRADGAIRIERSEPQAPELVSALSIPDRMVGALRFGSLTTKELATQLDVDDREVRAYLSRDQKRTGRERFVRLPDGRIGLRRIQ